MAPTPSIPTADKTTTTEAQSSTSTRRVAQLTNHLAPVEETEQAHSRPVLPIQYPVSKLQLDADRCIDHVRKLKVAVIGAGLAGINAGILLPAKVPGIELTIFEKNNDVASTPVR
jgi:heterodisulfide reductase subunit A-like polyferredoxin